MARIVDGLEKGEPTSPKWKGPDAPKMHEKKRWTPLADSKDCWWQVLPGDDPQVANLQKSRGIPFVWRSYREHVAAKGLHLVDRSVKMQELLLGREWASRGWDWHPRRE